MSHQASYKNILLNLIRLYVLRDIARSHFCYLQTSPQQLPWRQMGKAVVEEAKQDNALAKTEKNVAVVDGWQL